jgi:hypothetical protein
MLPAVDAELPTLPIGRSGRLEAIPLTNATGTHALLVREGDTPRALFTGERAQGSRERLILVPLDEDVEVRVDGDALAIWLAQGSVGRLSGRIPIWASALGYLLVFVVIGLLLLGSATFFGWLFDLTGMAR